MMTVVAITVSFFTFSDTGKPSDSWQILRSIQRNNTTSAQLLGDIVPVAIFAVLLQ